MLGAALSFGGRLGRLQFLLWSLGLAAVLTILTMTMVFASFDSNEPKPSPSSVGWIVLVVAPIYVWGTIALVSKRFRDIGWKPLYVILGWFAFWCFDLLVTTAFPALAAGDTNHTYLSAIVDVALVGALLLWPSGEPDVTGIDEEAMRRPYRTQVGLGSFGSESSAAQAMPGTPTGFGRKRN